MPNPSIKQFVFLAMAALPVLTACGSDDADVAEADPEVLELLMAEPPIEEFWLGDADAPVTIIEYASMTCSHCRDFHNNVYDALIEEYVETGEVRFAIREFPLDERATAAFMLARCAPGERGYYAVIDHLFETQTAWAFVDGETFVDTLYAQVQEFGFTRDSFDACLTNQDLLEGVNAVADRGAELGVNSTPTFFVNGVRYPGALSSEQLREAIAAAQ